MMRFRLRIQNGESPALYENAICQFGSTGPFESSGMITLTMISNFFCLKSLDRFTIHHSHLVDKMLIFGANFLSIESEATWFVIRPALSGCEI